MRFITQPTIHNMKIELCELDQPIQRICMMCLNDFECMCFCFFCLIFSQYTIKQLHASHWRPVWTLVLHLKIACASHGTFLASLNLLKTYTFKEPVCHLFNIHIYIHLYVWSQVYLMNMIFLYISIKKNILHVCFHFENKRYWFVSKAW